MPEERSKKWKEPKRLIAFLEGDNEELIQQLGDIQKGTKDDDTPDLTTSSLIEVCKELIYDKVEGKPVFHLILYSFDVDRCELSLGSTFDMLVGDKDTEDEVEEDIVNTLALAAGLEVPVYPNTEELAPELARYHRKMLIEGFTATDGDGDRVRLKLVKSPGRLIDKADYFRELKIVEGISPAELSLIRDAVLNELSQLRSAEKVLSRLSYAIDGLAGLLDTEERNEGQLQEWLTENPLLFGTEYSQVIPKHRLGAEFEMDYALKRYSGLVDLVEIESSSLRPFNKRGNPSQYLVHAEQQVLDWIDWIEAHGSYARDSLPGMYSPKAFVVIGRSHQLDGQGSRKLRRRNLIYRGQVEVLTYDHLLQRAINIRDQLLSMSEST